MLAELLWPEYAPDRARAALRRTLSTLRSALGGRWLAVARDAVSLEREGVLARRRRVPSARGRQRTSAELEQAAALAARSLPCRLRPARQRPVRRLAVAPGGNPRARARRRPRSPRRRARRARQPRARDRARPPPAGARAAERDGSPAADRALRRERRAGRGARAVPRVRPHAPPRARSRADRGDDGRLPCGARGLSGAAGRRSRCPLPKAAARDYPLVGREARVGRAPAPTQRSGRTAGSSSSRARRASGRRGWPQELPSTWARAAGSASRRPAPSRSEAGLAFGCAIELCGALSRAAGGCGVDPGAAAEAARLRPRARHVACAALDGPGAQARFLDGVTRALDATAGDAARRDSFVDDVALGRPAVARSCSRS